MSNYFDQLLLFGFTSTKPHAVVKVRGNGVPGALKLLAGVPRPHAAVNGASRLRIIIIINNEHICIAQNKNPQMR